MAAPPDADDEAAAAAAILVARWGAPRGGVILGSGFGEIASLLGAISPIPVRDLPGFPALPPDGHGDSVAVAERPGGRLWVFGGRLHLYQRLDGWQVAFPVRLLAAAGASSILQTCAAGGLRDEDRPGDFALVVDHLNLTGTDPLRTLAAPPRRPAFVDMQGAYDSGFKAAIRSAATAGRLPLRDGILAALAGPCYETPAEVRMLRALGADLASMSTVPETIAARFLGLRVAAIACISNRGAGLDAAAIAHEGVVETVAAAVRRHGDVFVAAGDAILG